MPVQTIFGYGDTCQDNMARFLHTVTLFSVHNRVTIRVIIDCTCRPSPLPRSGLIRQPEYINMSTAAAAEIVCVADRDEN